jgi:hypothetical protein
MTRRYDSFVLRRWQCGGERRVDVEHVQSGGQIRNATVTAAVGWISDRCGERPLNETGFDGLKVRKFKSSKDRQPGSEPSNLQTFEPYPSNLEP